MWARGLCTGAGNTDVDAWSETPRSMRGEARMVRSETRPHAALDAYEARGALRWDRKAECTEAEGFCWDIVYEALERRGTS